MKKQRKEAKESYQLIVDGVEEKFLNRFYPMFMQNFMLPLYDLAKGTSRFMCSQVLEKTQWLSRKEIDHLQTRNLHALLKYAYETVPYYRKVFKERHLLPGDIKNADDLIKLPVLTKTDIRKNFEDLISRAIPRDQLVPYESGGTGNPINFYITKEKISWEIAAEFRMYGWAGYRLGDRCFLIWGAPADLSKHKGMITRLTKVLERTTIVDAFVMSDEVLCQFVYSLRKLKPKIVKGYATPIYMVAKCLLENKISDVRPRAVITSAETLLYSRRKIIEDAFGCPVFDYYGSREVGAVAAECEQHSGYHISAENVVLEFVKKGEHVSSGESGVILVTNLRNFGMPFIRYEIGDVGKPSNEVCSCGRGLPLMSSIEGRLSEFMAVYDKRLGRIVPVSPAGPGVIGVALMHVPLESYRIIQESLDRVVIKAVKGKGYSQKHTDFLISYVRRFLGDSVAIEVEFVNYLPPLPSGKRSAFISKVNAFGD